MTMEAVSIVLCCYECGQRFLAITPMALQVKDVLPEGWRWALAYGVPVGVPVCPRCQPHEPAPEAN